MSPRKPPASVWDAARKLKLYRVPGYPFPSIPAPELLDQGVNFFVLALEQLGAITRFSCDGHGKDTRFYILFEAPYELALHIKSAGFFAVEVEGPGLWSLRFGWREERRSPAQLVKTLRWAADAWVQRLGLGTPR